MRKLLLAALGCTALGVATAHAEDVVAHAKAVVAKLSGPQTEWTGPTSAPKPEPGKKIAYLSGDENNDICRLYGVFMKEAASHIGWSVTVIDGKGTPTGWLDGMREAIALNPNGIAMCADAASLQEPIREGLAKGIVFIGLHAAATPGPHPDIHLFFNISEAPEAIGPLEADVAIADSNGHANTVVITHNEYAIAKSKSDATVAELRRCPGCKVLEVANFPASAASDRMPGLMTGWVQRYGLPLYVTSVGDNDFDFAVPALRAGGIANDQVKLIGADGNRSAYGRIRAGDQYQIVTVAEPFELQAYEAIDQFNRAFNKQPPSDFIQPPFLVTHANVDTEGGSKDMFFPGNHYKEHYLQIWGAKQ
ncbi:MAG TPA: substrate-binding domain-containing protein [Acetobacteraceae bacterium]|nr:substrate-binding domain-containing protein [Acetobacteraceae bacterium]